MSSRIEEHGVIRPRREESEPPPEPPKPLRTKPGIWRELENIAPQPAIGPRAPLMGLSADSELELWASTLPHTVVHDPSNAAYDGTLNAADIADVDGDGKYELEDVEAALADPAWRAQVDAARAALSDADRATYDAIAAEIAHDPRAALALEEMLVDGRLLAGDDAEGQNLLDALGGGTSTGADNTWLADLVQEVADPQTISQGGMNTCGAAVVATYLATNDPAEYARLVVGLVADGTVTTRDGTTLTFDKRVDEAWNALPANNRPSYGGLAFIEAMMEIGYSGGEYDPVRDGHEAFFGLFTTPGTFPDELARAFSAVTGRSAEWNLFGLIHRDEELEKIRQSVAAGEMVPAALTYNGTLHWVLVTGIDADGTIRYMNPWGRTETAKSEDFQRNLIATVHPR